MVYSSVGYCTCGQEIWIEFLWDGRQWNTRFQDDSQQEVVLCPTCGCRLEEDQLDSL